MAPGESESVWRKAAKNGWQSASAAKAHRRNGGGKSGGGGGAAAAMAAAAAYGSVGVKVGVAAALSAAAWHLLSGGNNGHRKIMA
jgi:hypothetical protein